MGWTSAVGESFRLRAFGDVRSSEDCVPEEQSSLDVVQGCSRFVCTAVALSMVFGLILLWVSGLFRCYSTSGGSRRRS